MSADPPFPNDLAVLWGPAPPQARPLRMLGLFAHPDDEVFCVGGTIARAGAAGVETAIVSLTRGEAGQIRDSAAATRRTLGATRVEELGVSASALGVTRVECLDLGDGHLARLPFAELVGRTRAVLERFAPDVVVTFGDDGGFGHPDHVMSSRATLAARDQLTDPPGAARPIPRPRSSAARPVGRVVGVRPTTIRGQRGLRQRLAIVRRRIIDVGVRGRLLARSVVPGWHLHHRTRRGAQRTVLHPVRISRHRQESADGRLRTVDSATAGAFIGQDGLATNQPRNAHVIARDDVTCFVLAPRGRDLSAGRGIAGFSSPPVPTQTGRSEFPAGVGEVAIDVSAELDRKIAALVGHRSQYALDAELLPRQVMAPLLGVEHFTVVDLQRD